MHILVHFWRIHFCETQWFQHGLNKTEKWAPSGISDEVFVVGRSTACRSCLCKCERKKGVTCTLTSASHRQDRNTQWLLMHTYVHKLLSLWSLSTNGTVRQGSLSKPRITMSIQNSGWNPERECRAMVATDQEKLSDKFNTSQGDLHHPHQFKSDWTMAIFLEHRENAASLYLSEDSSATLTPSPHASHSQRLQLLATVPDIVLYIPTTLILSPLWGLIPIIQCWKTSSQLCKIYIQALT